MKNAASSATAVMMAHASASELMDALAATPDGILISDEMARAAPQSVLNVQNAFNKSVQGKQIKLAATSPTNSSRTPRTR